MNDCNFLMTEKAIRVNIFFFLHYTESNSKIKIQYMASLSICYRTPDTAFLVTVTEDMTASRVPAETYSAYTHFLDKVKSCNIYLHLRVLI